MKKLLKIGAALTALVLSLTCLVACSNGEDGDSRSVVAIYQEETEEPWYYTFYSDGTYEYKENAVVCEKGIYSGSPTTRGVVTMLQEYWFDDRTEEFLPESKKYTVKISKEDDGLYLIDDYNNWFYLKD